ncbi:MAG: GGDEF domain-containing protein [Gammaproteobacteria bacterium]|nr:GGDEF domain-containing protein [Gammaproteobacteria bacterium]MBU0785749.1 GGDEF domain-containing protein [Gammaproteobacteria bacterium]MBU0813739.1 GGDEF domain-containing protein [Gammaproteobacteria bacterium]MBU1788789.1 GGDEF domain-containing protein [Gammaproteobacteria bacterium]
MKNSDKKITIAAFLGRVALLAAGVDCIYLLFFLALDSPVLAWVNVLSVAMYLQAYRLARAGRLHAASLLIWLEAFPHAALGTLMTGWESGFHYLLLMFIPAVVLTNSRTRARLFVAALLLFLVSLDFLARQLGPLAPLAAPALIALKWLNISIFVIMFSALASYFRHRINLSEKHLQALAMEDALTGLYNRRHFQQVAEQELSRSRRTGSQLALLIFDIDWFKKINDTHGHEGGDQVLISVGRMLKFEARHIDTLARWGGEEFVLLMPNADLKEAMVVAQRLRQKVEDTPVACHTGEVSCTVSGGLTLIQAHEPLNQAFARADRALYRSKREGRNRVSAEQVSEPVAQGQVAV